MLQGRFQTTRWTSKYTSNRAVADTRHVPAAQQHVPCAGLGLERLNLSKWALHMDIHEPVKVIWKLLPEVGSQRFRIWFADAKHRGQQLHLGVGKNHGEVLEPHWMKARNGDTFQTKTMPSG